MWSIANRYNTTVAILKELNNLNTNVLQIGQVLKLPGGGTTSDNQSENTYTVQSGDSLWSIANRYNTTVAILKELNNLNTNVLQIGQVLKLPGGDTTSDTQLGDTYIVQRGDSLWSIARKYDTTVSELQKLNNLTTTTLQIGQVLTVPTN